MGRSGRRGLGDSVGKKKEAQTWIALCRKSIDIVLIMDLCGDFDLDQRGGRGWAGWAGWRGAARGAVRGVFNLAGDVRELADVVHFR